MFTSIKDSDLEKLREEFKPIPDLRPGDKVRWKSAGMKSMTVPDFGEVCEVFRVLVGKNEPVKRSDTIVESDFTLLFANENGAVIEIAFDSRRFECVTEESKETPEPQTETRG